MANKKPQNLGKLATMGTEVLAGVLLGFMLGLWYDTRHGDSFKGRIIGACIGIVAGMYLMIKEALSMNRD